MRAAIALLIALCAAVPASAGGVATVGKQAPAFRLADLEGGPLTLQQFRGKPLYINVFASWCPPCRTELPRIVSAHDRFGDRVTFLGVDAQETSGVARRFAQEMKVGFPVALDRGQMAVSYGAAALPESVFIDRHGVVRAVVRGEITPAQLERNLTEIAS
ncbi:MAG TPA: TlpA disulfide reductase family protein [Candidatus Limnocylindria bacterium]|jgi:cytochrome c biogenesis protein CcmG/thiol:disulfide interchange protein DsbE|nr:TlpA disulfide reductase family protein [Candidatus Limnocylindria bacterium]